MPSVPATIREQTGLGLPLAISVLLLLAVVAAGVTQWMGAAHEEVAAEVTSLRAEAAARSGLEWARYRIVTDDSCPNSTTLDLDRGSGCTVELEDEGCQEVSVGGDSIYAVEMVGRCPLWGDLESKRTLRMRVRP
ncbi:hypothetical protein SAMN05660831_00155 [Thiohalospira halophila DSM 15071]|uniref:MSHA biogenesis protein MshP n=1 Tax=Thiohalospira halophila DSM 15071 TaxID=1123397 RepID=A0A1I1N9A7_9GAMM|nr:hypothetical protein [Thiohalospira halophila]SFC93822.1 hypothetical protein SAMN05660831_00155 [Thiohalospira halophila DSM 15071]